uniref:U4/U6 small nuclear ribonucleoprotein Prp3 n=1 Tax=Fragaria vesca subsp. vesca TaxID=101020 RepID=UPI0005C81A85|nr:PREDICTED: U4/U6 small nuclear ribonucleoprotein Prp3 [Fragaria vesca subsp. vesca]
MEKDKSSKRSRDERDRRDRDKHRSSRDASDDHHRHHRSRSDRDSKPHDHRSRRDRSPEPRDDRRERSYEREGSRERSRVKRERSEEGEDVVERRHKRKERERSEGVDDLEDSKRARGLDERRERKRFDDRRVKEEVDGNNAGGLEGNVVSGEVKVKKEELEDDEGLATARNGGAPVGNGASLDSTMASRVQPEATSTPSHPHPTKVYSISTTNENKGVSITRSHEVPGKSSTDGTSSTAGKSGNLPSGDIDKIKNLLAKHKELTDKLNKKRLNIAANASSDASTNLGLKDGMQPPSASTGMMHASVPSTTSGITGMTGLTGENYEAVKRAQERAARMGFRHDPEFAPVINLFPGQVATDIVPSQKPTKAPVLRLDALGREIDEHGNVVNVTKPNNLSTLKVNINKQKKDAFQILKPEVDMNPESNPFFDPKMGINMTKIVRPKRMNFQFVEEGKWSKEAEHMKLKMKFGELQAKEHRAKQAQLAKAKAAPDTNPNLIEVAERVSTKEKPKDPIPEVEWWDVPFLLSGTYGELVDGRIPEDRLKLDKITIYVEHPQPIEPPVEPAPPPPQPLKLTKKEQKKLRTQRRLAREKDKQEMIRQGLIEPPKPKVKMSNLMKVLGSEATQDPTRLEKEIRSAAAEREQAHIDRNIARKLTPAERREKKERKLFGDPNNVETIVSVYKINDLSHPKARFKIDVNARENRLTGCAVISEGMNVVVVEGGNNSIKRYANVMLRRINWAEAVKEDDEDEEENDDKPPNRCVLVWQGNVARPSFNRFLVHECMTEAAGRKYFADAGVGHYWDLAVNYADDE